VADSEDSEERPRPRFEATPARIRKPALRASSLLVLSSTLLSERNSYSSSLGSFSESFSWAGFDETRTTIPTSRHYEGGADPV
jgi:hypothetical protein